MREYNNQKNLAIGQMVLTLISCALCSLSIVACFAMENRLVGFAAAGGAILTGALGVFLSLKLRDAVGFGILAVIALSAAFLCITGYLYIEMIKVTTVVDKVTETYHTIQNFF